MKDLEFLSQDSLSLRRVVVYEGKHMGFLDLILKKLEKEFTTRSYTLLKVSPEGFLNISRGLALEHNFFVVDLRGTKFEEEVLEPLFTTSVESLIEVDSRALFLLDLSASGWEKVLEWEKYKGLRKDANVIEESEYSKNSFPSFFARAKEFFGIPQTLTNADVFQTSALELWVNLESIPGFCQALEFSANSFFFRGVNGWEFDVEGFRKHFGKKPEREYFVLHKLLALFLLKPCEASRIKLIEFITRSGMYESSLRAVVDTLYKVVFELSCINSLLKKSEKTAGISEFKMGHIQKYQGIPVENILRFLPRLAEYEPELLNRDTFCFKFSELLRELDE